MFVPKKVSWPVIERPFWICTLYFDPGVFLYLNPMQSFIFFIEYIRLPLGCVDLIGTLKVFRDISRHHRLKMRFAQSSMISQWVGGAMWLLQIFPSDADGRKLWSEMAYNKHLLTISQWLIDVKIWLVLWFDSEEVSKETEFPQVLSPFYIHRLGNLYLIGFQFNTKPWQKQWCDPTTCCDVGYELHIHRFSGTGCCKIMMSCVQWTNIFSGKTHCLPNGHQWELKTFFWFQMLKSKSFPLAILQSCKM